MPHGPALHEHDGMVTVFPRHRRQRISPWRGDSQLEASGGNVVALVHDHEAVVRDTVVHLSAAHQALHQGDVDPSERPPSSAEATDFIIRDAQKLGEPSNPLLEQLLAMDDDQGVDSALRNQPCGHHGLPERSSRGQDAGVIRQHGSCCDFLIRTEGAVEVKREGQSRIALFADGRPYLVIDEQTLDPFQTTPGKPGEFRSMFHAVDDPRLAVGGQAHRLRPVELGILKANLMSAAMPRRCRPGLRERAPRRREQGRPDADRRDGGAVHGVSAKGSSSAATARTPMTRPLFSASATTASTCAEGILSPERNAHWSANGFRESTNTLLPFRRGPFCSGRAIRLPA